jgi:hypothetical protein
MDTYPDVRKKRQASKKAKDKKQIYSQKHVRLLAETVSNTENKKNKNK